MAQYLIEITTSAMATEQVKEDPRTYIERVREAAVDLHGHLSGCWFAGDGDRLIAILHLGYPAQRVTVQNVFSQVWNGITVSVQPLYSAREMEQRSAAGDFVAAETLVDPVDLASQLSFPASDPPPWRYGGPAEADNTS